MTAITHKLNNLFWYLISGNCTQPGFDADSMLLQDIVAIELSSNNILYILCGDNGPGTVRLLYINFLLDLKLFCFQLTRIFNVPSSLKKCKTSKSCPSQVIVDNSSFS